MMDKIILFIKNLSEKQTILLLLGISFGLRLYAVLMSQGISYDGAGYGFIVRDFLRGDFLKGLSSPLHPFYPLIVSWITFDPAHVEISGRVISLFFGTMTLLPVYYLSKEIVGQRGAIFSGLFYSFHPYLATYSGMLLSEATYMGLLSMSVYFFWTGLSLGKILRIILSSGFLGLAYLTRPEGIGYFIIFFIWVVFFKGVRKGWLKKMMFLCATLLPLIILSTPYIIHIHRDTGQWLITKKGIGIQSELIPPIESRGIGEGGKRIEEKIGSIPLKIVKNMISFIPFTTYHYLRAYHFTLWLFLLFGLVGIKQRRSTAEVLVLSIIIFHIISLATFTTSTIRFSVAMVPISLIWAGAGVLGMEKFLKKMNFSKAGAWVSAIIVLALIVQLPQSLKPERRHRQDQKSVGLWLRENTPKNSLIMGNSPVEAFYAERDFILLPHGVPLEGIHGKSYKEIIQWAKDKKVTHILINKYTHKINPDFVQSIQPSDLKEFYRYKEEDGNMIIVYEVVY